MRRALLVLGSLAVIVAVAVGVALFTATDEITGGPAAPGEHADGDAGAAPDGAHAGTAGTPPSDPVARDGTVDDELAALLLESGHLGPDFLPVDPTPEEQPNRCGTAGVDDPTGSIGRAMAGADTTRRTLTVVQTLRAYPDPRAAAAAYRATVTALDCPTTLLPDGTHPTAQGSEVGGLGAEQAYAVTLLPAEPDAVPVGTAIVARVGTRVLTLRSIIDPTDQAAVAFEVAAVARTLIARLGG